MNCRQARQLFSPWLDGELTDEERRAFGEHLAACRSCAAELEKLQAVAAAMRNMRVPVAPPEGFAVRVTERLRRELTVAAGAGGEAAEPAEAAVVAAGKVVPLAGRTKSAPQAGGNFGREAVGAGIEQEVVDTGRKTAGAGQVFAGWGQGLRAGWRKSVAVAAALLMLLGGSATLAARYLGGPGIFNPPVVADRVPSPPAGADKDMNVDRVNPDNLDNQGNRGDQDTTPPDNAGTAPGTAGASQGNGGEKQPASPGSGGANGERGLLAGNSPGTPGQSPKGSAGDAGASGSSGTREVTSTGAGVEPKVFLNQPRAIESMLIKVRVRDLDAAAGELMAVAQAKGVVCKLQAEDKKTKIYRLPVPQAQADQFADYVAGLGQVFHRSRDINDVSKEFEALLSRYQGLIEERKSASGAQAQKLDVEIQDVEQKMSATDREAREQVVLIVWLE